MNTTYTIPNGTTFSISAKKKEISTALLGDYHQVYTITIACRGIKESFTFHDSIYNYRRGTPATEPMLRDALNSVLMDAETAKLCPSFRDFICEFGYGDEQKAEARRVFNGCHRNLTKVSNLFTKADTDQIFDTLL